MDTWKWDRIKIEICNTMFDCSFSTPFLSFSSICNVALNVSIALYHYKNIYANDLTSLLSCLTPHYLLLRED